MERVRDILESMRGLFGKHSHDKTVGVIRLDGEASVAIVRQRDEVPSEILAAELSPVTFEERPPESVAAGTPAISAVFEAMHTKYAALVARGIPPVSEVQVTLGDPWSTSKVVRATKKFGSDVIITEKMIADLAKELLAENSTKDQDLFEASVVRTELNGYNSGKPERKRARQLSLSVLMSTFQSGSRASVQRIVEKLFPHVIPTFRSSIRANTTVIQEVIPDSKDYLIVTILSGATAFTVVRDGTMGESSISEIGMASIVKRISASGMPEETLTTLKMLARDQCSEPACDIIRASMGTIEPELVRDYGEALGKCAFERRVPNTLVLLSHPDILPWMARFFARIDFAQFTLTTQPFDVRGVQIGDLSKLISRADGVVVDSPLATACGLVNIEASR